MSPLFPLDSCGGFACNVVDNSVDVTDLVNNTVGGCFKNVVGDSRPIGCHEVAGIDSPESDSVIICSRVAHYAYRTHVGQYGKVLVERSGSIISSNSTCSGSPPTLW